MFDSLNWFWLAIVASLAWSVSVTLLRFSNSSVKEQLVWDALGIFVFFTLVSFYNPLAPPVDLALGFFAGVVWVIASVFALTSLKLLGVSRVPGLWAGFSILASVAIGFFFGELVNPTNQLIGTFFLLAAAALIFLSKPPQLELKGFSYAIIGGFLWGLYALPARFVSSTPLNYALALGVGILLSSIVYARGFPSSSKENNLINFTAGLFWAIGNLSFFFAIAKSSISTALPVTQWSIVLEVIAGILIFKEAASRKEIVLILAAVVSALVGVYFLANSVG